MVDRVPFPFGPLDRGIADGANIALDLRGVARRLRGFYADGLGRVRVAPGTKLAFTLKDDQATPADITSVVALAEFANGALAVGHSTVTDKFYLYRFDAELTGWFDSGGVFQATQDAEPVGVLWATAPDPAKVLIAEGLGEAFFAHNEAGSTFQSRRYSVSGGLADLLADLRGSGNEVTYFRGVISFQQHLWAWGFGSLAVGQNDRPELLRFGQPDFGTVAGSYFAAADSFTIGHRVQSARESVVGAVVAGQLLYVGTNFSLWPISGFGRNSWDKRRPVSTKFGMAGPFAGSEAGPDTALIWSHRGPLLVAGYQPALPLWDALPTTVAQLVDPQDVVCVLDPDTDQVLVVHKSQASGAVRLVAGYDVRRNVFFGPDRDLLFPVGCAAHITRPTVAGGVASGPSAPPNTPSTTDVGGTVATANWVNGDESPGVTTIIEYKRTVDSTWIVAAEVDSSVTSYQFTELQSSTEYHWRAKHRRNAQDSTYLGPVAGTTFTTLAQLLAPTIGTVTLTFVTTDTWAIEVTWTNSESEAQTEVELDEPGGGTNFVRVTTRPPGASSHGQLVYISGQWCARVRHIQEGFTPSPYSSIACGTTPP